MKVILEFNLPEDTPDYQMHTQALGMYSVLHEMERYLTQETKYASDDVSDQSLKAYEECKECFHQALIDNDVSLEL
jgi:hypothetical protein